MERVAWRPGAQALLRVGPGLRGLSCGRSRGQMGRLARDVELRWLGHRSEPSSYSLSGFLFLILFSACKLLRVEVDEVRSEYTVDGRLSMVNGHGARRQRCSGAVRKRCPIRARVANHSKQRTRTSRVRSGSRPPSQCSGKPASQASSRCLVSQNTDGFETMLVPAVGKGGPEGWRKRRETRLSCAREREYAGEGVLGWVWTRPRRWRPGGWAAEPSGLVPRAHARRQSANNVRTGVGTGVSGHALERGNGRRRVVTAGL